MQFTKQLDLNDFEFWSGAKDFARQLTSEEIRQVEFIIEDLYHEKPPTETQINDLFWFEDNLICEWLGLDIDEVYNR